MYNIKFSDGATIEGLKLNGNTLISKTELTLPEFESAETIVLTATDGDAFENGETSIELRNVTKCNQVEINGEYYISFDEATDTEIAMTDMQMALAEVYEMILGG